MTQSESAESIFASWSSGRGGAVELETLCELHPEHSSRLRELYAEWSKSREEPAPRPNTPLAARQRLVRALFDLARSLPPNEREVQVRHAAGGDRALADEVLSLLAHATSDPDPKDFVIAAGEGTLSDRLRRNFGEGVDPKISLAEVRLPATESQALNELKNRADSPVRYRITGEVGRGGMGAVYSVVDRDLRRTLAMKVMREKNNARLSRFLEEAQITGQLDHPNIVPVHELGLDADGHVFFTMKLVRGETLSRCFEMVTHEVDGWNVARAMSVILRVCEAMAFAHEKGVIHRDLKPSNIMVGRFGEVYVMDWGLAQVMGHKHDKDIRIRSADSGAPISVIDTLRRERSKRTGDRDVVDEKGAEVGAASSVITMDGDVVGTPCYMPPEQAEGRIADIEPRSDVYAIGAMIYRLLTGREPYIDPEEHADGQAILGRVIEGPPAPIGDLAADAPAEVIAICEKAMSRNIDGRYESMSALADDVRAYLERRVVRAHGFGVIAELRKWVERNRALAVAAATLVLVLIGGTGYMAKRNVQLKNSAEEAKAGRKQVTALNRELEDLFGADDLEEAKRKERELFPAWPSNIAAMKAWLEKDAKAVDDLASTVKATIGDLDESLPKTPSKPNAQARAKDESTRRIRDKLTSLQSNIEEFSTVTRPRVEARLSSAQRIQALTLAHPNSQTTWKLAHDAIAQADGEHASSLYRAVPVDLVPQTGLVPIGMNPVSRLWEFYDLASACDLGAKEDPAELTIPTLQPDGTIEMNGSLGMVFVLIPGGRFIEGAQKNDPAGANYDPLANADEYQGGKAESVALDPFFLSKYEITRGQWLRLLIAVEGLGSRSSEVRSDQERRDRPVDQVSWEECLVMLERFGLELPTEARWEYACRAGTTTPWSFGSDSAAMPNFGNMQRAMDDEPSLVRIGTLKPNSFGLFDMHGNVAEWCQDAFGPYTAAAIPGTGERTQRDALRRGFRGGSYLDRVVSGRSANRDADLASARSRGLGVRPARSLRH